MTTRIVILISIFAFPFLWELYAAFTSDISLISPQLQYLGKEWNGFFIYVVNLVQGHVWFQPTKFSPAKYLNEYTEIGIVVFIGWIVFWVFRTFREALTPMTNMEVIILAVISFLIGAYFWNLAV